ncbi:mucin-like protein [Mya arenaria]|uniref:mucin-like protein n=1 Tax=Mya arenaria TaxID=6604 RepID=UPI0022E97BF9|nr:mucin-like protein [Mya arenaria]
MCGPCPDGFSEENDKCVDIDECSEESSCQDACNNVEGRFVCSCTIGYRVDVSDQTACTDINECDEGLDICPQQCMNTDGGYNCSCFHGFTYNDTIDSCIADAVQECEMSSCPARSVCYSNKYGNPDCLCDKGFDFNNSAQTCEDIDECKQGVCTQICRNNNGGYECSCHPGYTLLADRTCQGNVLER